MPVSFVIMITYFTSFVKALEENFFSPPKSLDFFISLRYNSDRVYPSEDTYMVAVAPFPVFSGERRYFFCSFRYFTRKEWCLCSIYIRTELMTVISTDVILTLVIFIIVVNAVYDDKHRK